MDFTHVKPPGYLVGLWTGSDVALEVDVVPFLEVGPVERTSEAEDYLRHVWNQYKAFVRSPELFKLYDWLMQIGQLLVNFLPV